MKKVSSFIRIGMMFLFVAGMVACSGVSEEQLASLDELRAEVKELEKSNNSLKSEKTKLEREIAEKNSKLDQCEKEKAETKANLQKLGK
jgi:septal ring factor EnvC (AmiA/AmiB activator)